MKYKKGCKQKWLENCKCSSWEVSLTYSLDHIKQMGVFSPNTGVSKVFARRATCGKMNILGTALSLSSGHGPYSIYFINQATRAGQNLIKGRIWPMGWTLDMPALTINPLNAKHILSEQPQALGTYVQKSWPCTYIRPHKSLFSYYRSFASGCTFKKMKRTTSFSDCSKNSWMTG